MAIGACEADPFRTGVLRDLVRRGLSGVKPMIGDAHEGIKAATACVLSTTWQRCRVHVQRNAPAHAGKDSRRVVPAFIATAFAQPDHAAAKAQWRLVADQVRGKLPKPATLMDTAEEDVLAYLTFPAQHRTRLHSTDPIERLNGEIQATHGRRRHLSERGFDPAPRRRDPHGADRGMDDPTRRYTTPKPRAPACDDLNVSLPAAQSD